MDDLISRQDAIKILSAQCYRGTDYEDVCGKDCECAEYMALRDLPSAQKKGTWIWDDEGYHCSECFLHAYGCTGEVLSGQWKYCPHCGAKMEGEVTWMI